MKNSEGKMETDKSILNWLSRHATFIIVINDNGSEEALKVSNKKTKLRYIISEQINDVNKK